MVDIVNFVCLTLMSFELINGKNLSIFSIVNVSAVETTCYNEHEGEEWYSLTIHLVGGSTLHILPETAATAKKWYQDISSMWRAYNAYPKVITEQWDKVAHVLEMKKGTKYESLSLEEFYLELKKDITNPVDSAFDSFTTPPFTNEL